MSDLAELIAAVRAELRDPAAENWSDDELSAQVAHALDAYNRVDPRTLDALLPGEEGRYEVAMDGLEGLLEVLDVWYPWDASAPRFPPSRPLWKVFGGDTLVLLVPDPFAGTPEQSLRVFYSAPHTIAGLRGAAASTLDAEGEDVLILGASAYAALQLAQAIIGTVTVTGWTPRQYADWAAARMKAFDMALDRILQRKAQAQDARVPWQAPYRGASREGRL
ncbi:MAG: hypothetical protein ACYC4R_17020 [Anaerolineae bacterium]